MNAPEPTGDAAAIIAAVRELAEPSMFTAEALANSRAVAVPNGFSLLSVKKFVDEYAERPDRKRGTSNHDTLGSFIEHVNRSKDAGSVVFADPGHIDLTRNIARGPSLTAVYDYNEAEKTAGGGLPRFGQHRAVYGCPLSEEWIAWKAKDGKPMSQADFAEFLEDRIGDVLSAPQDGHDLPEYLTKLHDRIRGKFAEPADLLDLSRGLKVHAAEEVASVVNLPTGEVEVAYKTEHTATRAGNKIEVPNLFLVVIPVFQEGEAYRIAVRLRYRKTEGTLFWFYQLWRADLSFRHAFGEVQKSVGTETGLSVFVGRPENGGQSTS